MIQTSVENLPLIKFLAYLLELKENEENVANIEDVKYSQANEACMARLISLGKAPTASTFGLKRAAGTGTVAGGAGAIAAATIIAAVTGKQIFVEYLHMSLSTDTAGGGIKMQLLDGSGGGGMTTGVGININQPTVFIPVWSVLGTVATLVEMSWTVAQYAALADGDTVAVTLFYREV